MDRQALQDLRLVLEPLVKEKGYELVDMYFRYESSSLILGILADRPEGGITIDECANLSRELNLLLDEKNAIQESYILEVSSPGIDRPLKTREDFRRCKGRAVIVYLLQPLSGKLEISGEIKEVGEAAFILMVEGKEQSIPFDAVSKAKQIIR